MPGLCLYVVCVCMCAGMKVSPNHFSHLKARLKWWRSRRKMIFPHHFPLPCKKDIIKLNLVIKLIGIGHVWMRRIWDVYVLNWFHFHWFILASLLHLYVGLQSMPVCVIYVHFYRYCTWIEHFSTIKFIGFNTIKLCGKLQANNWINYTIRIYSNTVEIQFHVWQSIHHHHHRLLPDAIASLGIFVLFSTTVVQRCSEF